MKKADGKGIEESLSYILEIVAQGLSYEEIKRKKYRENVAKKLTDYIK